jgi:hypothetical protein
MTQANDLGAIANVPGASYRTRVNAGFQAVASWHYGPTAPDPTYPLMLWGDQSTGKVWLRDAANSAWAEIGLLGPPFTWTAIGGLAGVAVTGDVKATFRSTADDGWVMMDDGSIGQAGSGATARANADCADLFALLWGNVANAHAPLQDSTGSPIGRGASSAADWAANRRLVLPKMLGRAIACAGWGADLSDRALGEAAGAETHTLTVDEMPLHGHAYRASLTSQSTAQSHTSGGFMHNTGGNSNRGPYTAAPSTSVGIGGTGGGQAHSIISPAAFLNFQIKL